MEKCYLRWVTSHEEVSCQPRTYRWRSDHLPYHFLAGSALEDVRATVHPTSGEGQKDEWILWRTTQHPLGSPQHVQTQIQAAMYHLQLLSDVVKNYLYGHALQKLVLALWF